MKCGAPLNEEGRCPKCGLITVTSVASVQAEALKSISREVVVPHEAILLIDWEEVDRLLRKKEYAAAVLVAAINVEFTLQNYIFPYKQNLNTIKDKEIRSQIPNIKNLSLSTCFNVAKYLAANHGLILKGDWENQVQPLIDPRKKIAHSPGYFAAFTKLKIMNKNTVRELIKNAREFCDANLSARIGRES
ncbi:MAG: hypothetical protein QXX19_05385 [Candidatus Caldarchaeum sp.]